ncbi:MAG TPA: hypothetical protein VMF70_07605, partial [Gemmatimonadales bacterium]|nr:hypothetical protein [Gemmatimonadales bacterium]
MNRFAATRRLVGASLSLAAIILVASTCGGEKSFTPPQPASISRSAGDTQTGTAGQMLPTPLEVKVVDGSGAPVSGVSVSWYVVSGGGSVTPATSITGSTGLAQTSWKLGRVAGANVVSASLPGSSLIPPINFTASATAAAPSALAFTVPPTTATAGGAMTPALQVTVQDSMGNTVTTATNNVTVAIGSNPAGGTLTGTASVAATSGVATFSNLSINKAGTGYTLTASASGLTGATSAPFAVNAGAAAKLAFTTPPSSVAAGAAISPAVAVTVQDALGNTVTGASNSVTVAIGTNPASGTLSGTSSVAAVSGVATFSTLSIDKAGTGYTLTAAASGLAGATSGTFNVAVGAASQLVWTQQPGNVVAGATMSPATLTVEDAHGNVVTSASGTVTLVLTTAGGATLTGGGAASVVNGVATFSGLSVDKAGSYTLTPATTVAGVTGLPASSGFTVSAGVATQIAVNAGNNQSAAGGTAVSVPPSVVAKDAFGNPVAGVSVTFGVASGGGTVVPTTPVTTNASGIAQVTSWTLGAAAGTNTLTATSTGLTGSPLTFTATGTAGAATQIAINAGNNQSATAGTAVSVAPSVIVRDANNNPVSGASVTFAVATGGGTVVPTTAVTTNASGIAQVTSWTLGTAAGSNTLTATSAGLTGSPVTLTATATAGAATQIAVNAGNAQSATVGTAVAVPPSVIVRDANNNPVSGASVTFAVASGGGTVVPTTAVTTNASGIAQVTSWTLGTTAGANSLTATSAGLTGSPLTFTATATAGAATQIAINAGSGQSATAGAAVAIPPSVIVRDAGNNPVSGVSVTFAVASGGGTVAPTSAVVTDAGGIAQVTSWTLGTSVGANTLTATSAGLTGSPVT